ncbi:MAG: SUMF1/EgtB/PvdO family nonheme iron enzyme [Verrucomicrobia bacterium]|nr:SUMF1/EgtB/PvdO family nonheme iron enzyme [Verrucomicrobiota bacterium]
MDAAPQPQRLGDYLLQECLADGPFTRTWLAVQESVRRTVLVEELRPEHVAQAEVFLADIRAKAAVDHPLIASVFEAVAEPGLCYYAHERLAGATLAQRIKAFEPMKPARLAYYLRRIAEANLYYEARGYATDLFGPAAVHLDEQGVIRLQNLTLAGPRAPEQSLRDVVALGIALPVLVADGLPGATRMLTLLAWMRGTPAAAPLSWKSIHGYCEQIEQQLADPLPKVGPMTAAMIPKRKIPLWLIGVAAGLALLGIAVVLLNTVHRPPPPPARGWLPEAVAMADGEYLTPDGGHAALRAFRLSAHEVTIGQYAKFLDALELLAQDGRGRLFDHANQPADKTSHLPTDWAELLAAARANGTWQGRPVTPDSPVIGVDWWDAAAYAEWKQARLPTQEEWFAALCQSVKDPATLKPGPWQPATLATPDRTPSGLLGMAGSVAEWTLSQAVNPANPLGQRLWVISGASYLKPANGALAREWVEDRSLRRPDLGFRVVFDPQ